MNPYDSGMNGLSLRQLELRDEAWRRLRDVATRDPEVRHALRLMETATRPLLFVAPVDRASCDTFTRDELVPVAGPVGEDGTMDVRDFCATLSLETGVSHRSVFVAEDVDTYRRVL